MAANSQQFRQATEPTRRVHGLSSLSLEDKIDKLTNIVQTLLTDKMSLTRLCGICTKPDHLTDSCSILHEDSTEQANAFNQPYQQRLPLNQQLLPPKLSLETVVERLTNSIEEFQLKTEMHLQELDKQVSRLALMISHLGSQSKLPSQIKPNPRYNVNSITLRSGKVLEPVLGTSRAHDAGRDEKKLDTKAPVESAPQKSFIVPPPFPGRLV
ncbi:hypothetical protein CXB51_035652 [Gossypium anomalum]|uniref:Uncharacterized protein n=1 Tax=Gossypium anomalum TaxID=47600 RepID=A0A8J6CKG9_9ROSI|nr:hypothetical protein CXB51_035652 [Gossypium anomalum]